MNLGPHADFIVAAYAVTVFVVAALIGFSPDPPDRELELEIDKFNRALGARR